MKRWEDVKKNLSSLSDTEKEEIEVAASIVSQIVNRRHKLGLGQRDLLRHLGSSSQALHKLRVLGTCHG